MAQQSNYLILTAVTADALQNLITGSMAQGYVPVGPVAGSGSALVQEMMIQYANNWQNIVNPERFSRAYRTSTTASAFYTTSSGYL